MCSKNLKKWTDEHPCVTKAMKNAINSNTSGKTISDNQIWDALTYGNKPVIEVLDDVAFEKKYKNKKGKRNPSDVVAFFWAGDGKIRMRSSMALKGGNEALLFNITMTIMHELVHFSVNLIGYNENRTTQEYGDKFEYNLIYQYNQEEKRLNYQEQYNIFKSNCK